MNEEEELYGLVVEWLALYLAGEGAQKKHSVWRRVEIDHYFMSTFERNTYTLAELGILKNIKGSVCLFKFAVGKNKLAEKAVRNKKKGPSLDQLLVCFFDVAGMHTQRLELKTSKAFKVHPDRDRMFDLFKQLGYLERHGPFCYWTKKADAIMDDKYIFFDRGQRSSKEPFR